MQFGICLLSIVPARKEPSHASEMVTQLLFGEHYKVLEVTEGWLKILTALDNYECWINIKQHNQISDSTYNKLNKNPPFFLNEPVQVMHNKMSGRDFPISIGSCLPFFKNQVLSFESHVFGVDGQVACLDDKRSASEIISASYLFLNAPYLWGGKSIFGIDCSGFVQTVFKLNGYMLPRDAWQQAKVGHPLSFVDESGPGDLAFFDNEEGTIVHVGILLDNERIIHASGFVRIDKFDHYGIFNSETKKYSHTLRVIKRII